MTRKLQAQEDFEKGDVGCATGHKVSKTTQPGRQLGSFLVTALQDVKSGAYGWFEDQRSQEASAPKARAVGKGDRSSRRGRLRAVKSPTGK